MDNPSVGVIIPAHNEESRIAAVLDVVCTVGWIEQVVVVDDNSDDATHAIACDYLEKDNRFSVLHLPVNSGKSQALLAGLTALPESIQHVIFLDADLINLQPKHLEDLYLPIRNGRYQMSIGMFRSGTPRTDAAQIVTPQLSGQRCLKRSDALKVIKRLEDSGYGVEIGLTLYARRNKWKIIYVAWKGVSHVVQEHKLGLVQGTRMRANMYLQILATWIKFLNIKQWSSSD